MAERSPNPRALVQFDVMASVDLTACGGFRSLAPPPGGFLHGGSGPHFFQVSCLFCGEDSKKDVALYALPPGEKGCSGRLGPRLLTKLCRPTCPNPAAHLVRKCACREVGSIELQEVAASLTAAGPLRFLNIKSQGYKINEYTAAQEWEAVAATGEEVPVVYDDERGVFKGPNAAGNQVSIPAQFVVVPKEE